MIDKYVISSLEGVLGDKTVFVRPVTAGHLDLLRAAN
jgi:hypothetical protein